MAINTPIFIYIQNNTTGRLIRLQSISTNGGLVQIDTTDIVFNKNQNYECWATLLSSTAIDNRISLTGNEQTYTCASLNFKQLFDKDNVTTTYY